MVDEIAVLTISPSEIKRITGLSKTTINRLVRTGRLIRYKCGRRSLFRLADVQQLIANLPRG